MAPHARPRQAAGDEKSRTPAYPGGPARVPVFRPAAPQQKQVSPSAQVLGQE